MKKYRNLENGRVAVLVVDNLTKTMKYEDDGKEEIITPATFKHGWEFVSEDEPTAPVEIPVEEPKEEPKQEPEIPTDSEPVEEPSDSPIYAPCAPRVKLKNGKRVVSSNFRGGTMARRKTRHIVRNRYC